MSEKKINKETLFVTTCVCICCSFMIFTVMFFPAVNHNGIDIDGLFAVFGGDVKELGKFNFNPFALIAYLLPFGSLVFSFKAFHSKKFTFDIISMVISFVAAVLIILEPLTFNLVNNASSTLAFGPIVGSLLCVVVIVSNAVCISIKNVK